MVDNLRFWRVPIPLTGNAYFYGRTDSGKSWKMIALAQGYRDRGSYKLWHFFGGKRKESCFWCFPSEEKKLWENFEFEAGTMNNLGPKEYKVNILTFCFSSKLPNKLPELLPRISHKLVTIPFRQLTLDDISLVIGDISSNAKYVWNTIIRETNKYSTGEDILYLMETKLKRYKELSIFKNFIEPAISNHLFSSEVCPLNINIEEEAENKEVITILNEEYILDDFKWFIPNYIMKRILNLAMEEKIHKKNIGICQEVSSFMKVQDKNIQFSEQTQIFRNQISDIARYARSGLFLFMDCQSPAEVAGLISGQDDLMGINEMPSAGDREALCFQLLKDKRISKPQMRYLYNIPVYQMVLVCRGQTAKLIKRVMPPRTQCWKPTIGNFNSHWKLKYNSYTNIKQALDIIINEYKESKAKIQESIKRKQEEDEIEKEQEEMMLKKIKSNTLKNIETVVEVKPNNTIKPEIDITPVIDVITKEKNTNKKIKNIEMLETELLSPMRF